MKTIKNTKLFNELSRLGSGNARLSELMYTISSRNSEFYLDNLPLIRVKRVGVYSDQIVFFDTNHEENGVYRDNTFRIIPEEEK